MRAEAQSSIDEAWQEAQHQREQLLAEAKQQARLFHEQARQAVERFAEIGAEQTAGRPDLEPLRRALQLFRKTNYTWLYTRNMRGITL